MGQIKKLYQDEGNVEIIVSTEEKAVYPITASSAVYHQSSWGSLGAGQATSNILAALDEGYLYVGMATPNTNPRTYNHKVFYLASEAGTYTHFGGLIVSGLTVLKNSGNGWDKEELNITGGGGGGDTPVSTGGFIGSTPVRNTSGAQDLTGISNIYLESNARIYFGGSGDVYLEYGVNGFHFSQSVYSDGQVAAGGIGSGSGGGGGGGTSYLAGNGITIANDTISVKIGSGLSFNSSGALVASGGGIANETDPIFTASPAHGITAQDIARWNAASGSTSLYALGTQVLSTTSTGTLYGATTISANPSNFSGTDTSAITWDSNNNAWHIIGNLYADGWVAAGGLGTNSTDGMTHLRELEDVYHTLGSGVLRANGGNVQPGDALVYNSNLGWVAAAISGGGGSGTVTAVKVGSTSYSPNTSGVVSLPDYPTVPSSLKNPYALTFGNKSYDGSSSVSLTASDLGALTSHQAISTLTLNAGTFTSGTWTPTGSGKSFNIPTTAAHLSYGNDTIKAFLDDLPNNYVTLDTPQEISGAKTFKTNPVNIHSSSAINVDALSYIDIGSARLIYDSGARALHVTIKDGDTVGTPIGLFADGPVSAGGAANQTTISYVTTGSGAQSIAGTKTFTGTLVASGEAQFNNDVTINADDVIINAMLTLGGISISGSSSLLSINKNTKFSGLTNVANGTITVQQIVDKLVWLENQIQS